MNVESSSMHEVAAAARPRLVKAADRAADREARLQKALELNAKRELSLNAILNRAAGREPRSPRAMFDALFEVGQNRER